LNPWLAGLKPAWVGSKAWELERLRACALCVTLHNILGDTKPRLVFAVANI